MIEEEIFSMYICINMPYEWRFFRLFIYKRNVSYSVLQVIFIHI